MVIVPIMVGALGAIVLYLEGWWKYRLERHTCGTLRVRTGLVIRREVTFAEEKMIGAEYTEPLATRFAHRVRVAAVATGAGSQRTLQLNLPAARKRILMPLGPAERGQQTVQRVLLRDVGLTDLQAHPVQARNQRIRWGVGAAAAVTLLATLLLRRYAPESFEYAWPFGALALILALLVALDNYRALGHRLTPHLLVSRWGTWIRRTSAIDREAVVGWVFSQTYFQWRLGLVTLTASTAAGSGGYTVRAVGIQRAVELVRQITPGLLEPFEHAFTPAAMPAAKAQDGQCASEVRAPGNRQEGHPRPPRNVIRSAIWIAGAVALGVAFMRRGSFGSTPRIHKDSDVRNARARGATRPTLPRRPSRR